VVGHGERSRAVAVDIAAIDMGPRPPPRRDSRCRGGEVERQQIPAALRGRVLVVEDSITIVSSSSISEIEGFEGSWRRTPASDLEMAREVRTFFVQRRKHEGAWRLAMVKAFARTPQHVTGRNPQAHLRARSKAKTEGLAAARRLHSETVDRGDLTRSERRCATASRPTLA